MLKGKIKRISKNGKVDLVPVAILPDELAREYYFVMAQGVMNSDSEKRVGEYVNFKGIVMTQDQYEKNHKKIIPGADL